MSLLSRADILRALEALARELEASGATIRNEIVVAGGAAIVVLYAARDAPGKVLLDRPALLIRALAPQQLLAMKLSAWRDDVDIGDARVLLQEFAGERTQIWSLIEPFLVPGRELKARYAFDDLWESERGS